MIQNNCFFVSLSRQTRSRLTRFFCFLPFCCGDFHARVFSARVTNHLSFSSNHHASGCAFKSRAPTAFPASVFRRFTAIVTQLRAFILPFTSSSRNVVIHSRLS